MSNKGEMKQRQGNNRQIHQLFNAITMSFLIKESGILTKGVVNVWSSSNHSMGVKKDCWRTQEMIFLGIEVARS